MKITPQLRAELLAQQQSHPDGLEAGLEDVLRRMFAALYHEKERLREQIEHWQHERIRNIHEQSQTIQRLRQLAESDNDEVVYYWLSAYEVGRVFYFDEALIQMVLQLSKTNRALRGDQLRRLQYEPFGMAVKVDATISPDVARLINVEVPPPAEEKKVGGDA